MKVIYQVEDCYAFEDGEETRYTHRLLSSILAHEVIHTERPKLDPQEEKRKQRRFAKQNSDWHEAERLREIAEREVHLFRMREIKREVDQTIHEWKADVAKERDTLSQKSKTKKGEEDEKESQAAAADEGKQKCC